MFFFSSLAGFVVVVVIVWSTFLLLEVGFALDEDEGENRSYEDADVKPEESGELKRVSVFCHHHVVHF